jgi:hypothetical protein
MQSSRPSKQRRPVTLMHGPSYPYGPGLAIASLSKVTAPARANNRPLTIAPTPSEIDACARMVPLKTEDVFSVAELPTCQKTLHALAPLINVTLLPTAVISVDAAWNIKTLLGLF